jgi:hypothetical protein
LLNKQKRLTAQLSCVILLNINRRFLFIFGEIFMKLAVEVAVMELDGEWDAVAVLTAVCSV